MGTQPPKRGMHSSPPIFGPCMLWSNGWKDQDANCYGDRPWTRPHCVRWGPSPSLRKGPMSVVAKRSPISATAEHLSSCACSGRKRLGISDTTCLCAACPFCDSTKALKETRITDPSQFPHLIVSSSTTGLLMERTLVLDAGCATPVRRQSQFRHFKPFNNCRSQSFIRPYSP